MLTFLYLAAKAGVVLADYEDDAVGIMEPERARPAVGLARHPAPAHHVCRRAPADAGRARRRFHHQAR